MTYIYKSKSPFFIHLLVALIFNLFVLKNNKFVTYDSDILILTIIEKSIFCKLYNLTFDHK